MRIHAVRIVLTALIAAATCAASAVHIVYAATPDPLRKLLGKDLDGAVVLANRELSVVRIDLRSRATKTLATFPKASRFQGLSRPWLSADGKQVVLSYGGKCALMNSDGSGRRSILKNEKVCSPSFWDDPKTGERCIVYKNIEGKHWYRRGRSPGPTWLHRLKSGKKTKLADFPMDGGLSPDGSHLGEAYGGCLMKDLTTGKMHVLYRGKQSCNATMSPDNTYRMMHLYLPHKYFGIRDKFDREHWRITNPKGSGEWQAPRWSNHPNFCMATLKYGKGYRLAVVKIDTKDIVVLNGLGEGWSVPQLWLPSAAKGAIREAGPLAGLKLKRLRSVKTRLATAADYTPIINELSKDKSGEARMIVAALESHGRRLTAKALRSDDPTQAQSRYREIATKFSGHPLGKRAAEVMNSATFKREVRAWAVYLRLAELAGKLAPVKAVKARFAVRKFFEPNRPVLVQMVQLAGELTGAYAGTAAASRARPIIGKYALPSSTRQKGNRTLELIATIDETSIVPAYRQGHNTYTECLTQIIYRVDKVLRGEYKGKKILIVHWGMLKKKRTPAAKWKPGAKQRLLVDLFAAHKDLEKLDAATDANDFDLMPYRWSLDVKPAR
jgi:hypothetical protein